MDILNWIHWLRNGRYIANDIPSDSLIAVAVKDNRRDDKWLTVAAPISALTAGALVVTLESYQELYNLVVNEELVPGAWYRFPYRSVNFLNGWQNANNNTPGIFPSYNAREIYEGEEEEILLVQAISTFEIANDAYSESYPGDVIQFAPYTNKIGVGFDISNGNNLPNSSTVSGFDLQWDGTNVYFNMPAGYPALFGHYLYLYCEFDDGVSSYYQDGTYEPLTPGVSNCQYPYTSDDPDYGYPKAMSRLQVVNNGTKILLLDLTQTDVANYQSNTLYVETVYALGDAYGWITRRNDTLKNISIPFDFRGRKYRRYETEAFGLITSINYSSTGSTATDGTYYNMIATSVGNGIGAQFQVEVVGGVVTDVRIMSQGMLYASGDTLTIFGVNIGGSSADNIDIAVTNLDSNIGYYAIGTSIYLPLYGSTNVPADVYKDFKTFSDGSDFYNIDWSGMGGPDSNWYTGYSDNNLFIDCSTYDNIIEDYFVNNTLVGNFSNNKIGSYFRDNIAQFFQSNNTSNNLFFNRLNNLYSCSIKNSFYSNVVSGTLSNSNIGAGFHSNLISGGFEYNNIEDYFIYNKIQAVFTYNTVRNYFSNNYIGQHFENNTIGNTFDNNKINNYFKFNRIGSYFYLNKIKDDFGFGGSISQGNTIGNYFYNNTIGEYFYNNVIADDFHDNTILDFFQLNNIKTSVAVTDFTTATYVYGNFNCDIFLRSDSSLRLSYIDNTDVINYDDIDN